MRGLIEVAMWRKQPGGTHHLLHHLPRELLDVVITPSCKVEGKLIREIKTMEVNTYSQISELSKKYGRRHPKMLALESERPHRIWCLDD